MQAFAARTDILTAYGVTGKQQRLLTVVILITQHISISPSRSASVGASILQGIQYLVGHIPVRGSTVFILQIQFKSNGISRLQS